MTARDRLETVTRLAEMAATPGGIAALRTWRPLSIAAFRLVHGLAAEGLSFATVIDVGANVGKFSRAALGMWPAATVIAFEALPAAAEEFQAANQLAGRVELHKVALGAHDGTIAFYPHEYSLSSSPLPVPAAIQRRYPWARETPPIEVPVRRLDAVLAGRVLAGPVLMKLDVQGYELEVLAGAPETLASVTAIVIEQAFDAVYQDQPLFGASHRALEQAGWRLVRPLDWRREGERVAEMDCLYVRAAATER
jgi:FkbM family methyltransferase